VRFEILGELRDIETLATSRGVYLLSEDGRH
jgi:hypothetical protein